MDSLYFSFFSFLLNHFYLQIFPRHFSLDRLTGFYSIGWIIGVWVCTVMMSVIKGAVNTLIVCWADSPAVFEAEHPILSGEMIQAWSSVFTHTNIPLGRSSYPVHNGVHA